MKWANHIDITDAATKSIFPDIVRAELCDMVVDVDRLRGYGGHHDPGRISTIMSSLMNARQSYLRGNEWGALYSLAEAVHYIQDLCLTYGYGRSRRAEEVDGGYIEMRVKEYDERYSKGYYYKYPINHVDRPYAFFESVLKNELKPEAMNAAYKAGDRRMRFYRRLTLFKPSPTLVTCPAMKATMMVHPWKDRLLSIREYLRIQEFPDEWRVVVSIQSAYRLFGEAVPVPLARAIARAVRDRVLGLKTA